MTRPSPEPVPEPPPADGPPELTRRRLLQAASVLALTAAAPRAGPGGPDQAWRGEPFDDGTYFDDGYGWVD